MNLFNKYHQGKIVRALVAGNFDFLIEGLETSKIDPNMMIYKSPFLNQACRELGAFRLVQKLIEKGAQVNQFDAFSKTPVMTVAERYLDVIGQQEQEELNKENEALLSLLKGAGADFDQRDDKEKTPLERLIKESNPFHYRNVFPAGYFDIFNNYQKRAELLIKYGANVNAQDEKGQTPLMLAIQQRSLLAVLFLLSNGANVNLADGKGETAFIKVIQDAYFDGIQIKSNNGMLQVDETKKISDIKLVVQQRLLRILESLISAGADLVQKNKEGFDAYNLAMKKGHVSVAKVIMKRLQKELRASAMYGKKISQAELVKTLNSNAQREKD